jgi:hypothetical protein
MSFCEPSSWTPIFLKKSVPARTTVSFAEILRVWVKSSFWALKSCTFSGELSRALLRASSFFVDVSQMRTVSIADFLVGKDKKF